MENSPIGELGLPTDVTEGLNVALTGGGEISYHRRRNSFRRNVGWTRVHDGIGVVNAGEETGAMGRARLAEDGDLGKLYELKDQIVWSRDKSKEKVLIHHSYVCYNKHHQSPPPDPPQPPPHPIAPPVLQNDTVFYHHDHNRSLNSHSGESRTQWSDDLRRPSRGILATGGRRCCLVSGGSPFIACCSLCEGMSNSRRLTAYLMIMADSPTHFFKFIPPALKYDLSIPSSLLTNLNHGRCSKAILRRGRHEWSVDIDDGVFGDGWRKFVRENGVQEFDFIVFKHQGSMVFDFLVFDKSACERQYLNLLDKMDLEEPPLESDTISAHRPKNLKRPKRNEYASQDQEKYHVQKENGSTIKKATSSTLNDHTYFISNLKGCSFKSSVLYLPTHFTKQNGLKIGEMILIDNKGRSWEVQLKKKRENEIYIGCGFKAFSVANRLKEGDTFKFALVEKEKNKPPVANFFCPITFEEDDRRCFMGEMKSILQQSHLYLTQEFARLNGLINKKQVILKNTEDERLWTVDLKKYKNSLLSIHSIALNLMSISGI
ncbi:hypothetical protein L1887_19635 [Cichorium endivia]|nr:hypothetical protein L1887_19635 [Cichorium endivia]